MTTKTEVLSIVINTNLQEALAVLVNRTVSGVDAASGFLQEQIPDVIHQLLVWKMCEALFYAVLCVVIVIIALAFFKVWYKNARANIEKRSWDDDSMVGFIITSGISLPVGGIPLAISFVKNILTALQIWLAPKVWLIEYAASLVK